MGTPLEADEKEHSCDDRLILVAERHSPSFTIAVFGSPFLVIFGIIVPLYLPRAGMMQACVAFAVASFMSLCVWYVASALDELIAYYEHILSTATPKNARVSIRSKIRYSNWRALNEFDHFLHIRYQDQVADNELHAWVYACSPLRRQKGAWLVHRKVVFSSLSSEEMPAQIYMDPKTGKPLVIKTAEFVIFPIK